MNDVDMINIKTEEKDPNEAYHHTTKSIPDGLNS